MNLTFLLIFAIVWVVIGAVTGLWMIRRGHDPAWVLPAVLFGPLFVPIAMERVERNPRLVATGPDGLPGAVAPTLHAPRVLVGLDGSPQSELVLSTTLRVFGRWC
ncbi:hypothetical protein BOX37_13885 [Nocardia mangyaensis]|uniref:Uncharacterized protein n=1 Tax=Nocardia mangyaensis TaxID=2213200 RepID=A0A1J0VS71_9NOCA|nr:hypothetical protein [Nocardia mangyaensis]APE34858.1 hypothetical protein BOX37_13885 [Nocardia mangyaensis]